MNLKTIFFTGSAILSVGCSEVEVLTGNSYEEHGIYKIFSSKTEFSSRVTSDGAWENGDAIGLYVFESESGKVTSAGINVKYNAAVEDENAVFSPENTAAVIPDVNSDFVAYYPFSEDVAKIDKEAAVYKIDLSDQTSGFKNHDLIYAKLENQSVPALSGGGLSMDFSHKLSLVQVNVKGLGTDETVNSITVSGLNTTANFDLVEGVIKNEGNIGNIVEEALGLKNNNEQCPDFKELGVELKATPVEDGKKQEWKAGERLVITMISYLPKDNEINGRQKRFEETHLAQKLARILLCVYKRPANHKEIDRGDLSFCKVTMFTVPAEDMPIIRQDWSLIMSYVFQGRANELSESLTKYLGACTKGADGSTLKRQGYPPFAFAKPRAFCLKTSYMTYLQNNFIMKDRDTYVHAEKIGGSFEDVVINRMSRFIGKTDE